MERAIRSWAHQDAQVASVVASIDKERIRYIEKLLAINGVKPDEQNSRALFLYRAYLGQQLSSGNGALTGAKVDVRQIEKLVLG